MGSSALIGQRSSSPAVPAVVLRNALEALSALSDSSATPATSFLELKKRYAMECRVYYSLAALSRRANLDQQDRVEALGILYLLRSRLENAIINDLRACGLRSDLLKIWSERTFFGVSAKQGVSVRYALASCVPTRTCGARCYAHDGRDREIHHIFRGSLNYFVGQQYELAEPNRREMLLNLLEPAIHYGISEARRDQANAKEAGFERPARIRFSHVGEMTATPGFTNDLARRVRQHDSEISCVIYTRHPRAKELDGDQLVVNFTLEGVDDNRATWIPNRARVVASAWDGELVPTAEINFLEHHVEKFKVSSGQGAVCPVTANHSSTKSCDEARCQMCFVPATNAVPADGVVRLELTTRSS